MSDDLFEVAFSGQTTAGADREAVKARLGKMFNAQGAKLDTLFSGQRIVIKKNVDEATARKYEAALLSVGAECEISPAAQGHAPAAAAASPADEPRAQSPAAATPPAPGSPPPAAAPPNTDPLGITAEQIGTLEATVAPPGSELQDESRVVPEPQFDLSAYEMAPAGSTLSDEKKEPPPPPPDTSGLSLAD